MGEGDAGSGLEPDVAALPVGRRAGNAAAVRVPYDPGVANYTAKRISEMEAGYGGGFVKARAELGVTAFGMQVIRLPADFSDYPEHDHAGDGQEEVYIPFGGSGWLDIEGERVELDGDLMVRVPAGTRRKLYSGPEGMQVLVIGGCPGEGYKISSDSELTTS